MPKIGKNFFRPSINLIACPAGFLMSGRGIQKDCKKDFDKYQYTKKFVFSCHTVTHGIDFRKSPHLCNLIFYEITENFLPFVFIFTKWLLALNYSGYIGKTIMGIVLKIQIYIIV